jgi:hypothetical protein
MLAGDFQNFRRHDFGLAVARIAADFESRRVDVVNLAEVVIEPRDFQPGGIRRDHFPRHQVIQRRAPQHGLLAACIHGDVAADGGGVGRGRVDGKRQSGLFRGFHHAARDHARAAMDGRRFFVQTR